MTAYIMIPKWGREHTILLDREDYRQRKDVSWEISRHTHHNTEKFYARKNVKRNGKWKYVYLHRLIMNALPSFVVDHINGNGLDNRRENLRITTQRENAAAHRQSHSKKCVNHPEYDL